MSDTNPKKQEFISPEYPSGPLVVSEANPRYFTIASGSTIDRKAVYLTGSYIWNNFHDGLGPGPLKGFSGPFLVMAVLASLVVTLSRKAFFSQP